MACAEQPLKKRRLYDTVSESQPPAPQVESPSTSAQVSSIPAPVTPPPPSQEDIQTRIRNREEIRKVHECYKRLKSYIGHRDGSRYAALEQAYRSLISASKGCTSVKRLVADLVPRYALYCPTAIGDAVQAVIDMHNFSLEPLDKGQDADGVSFHTAKACIFGLVDLCSAASSNRTSSPGARDICSAVFRNVLTFFVLSFEGKEIFQIVDKSDLKLQDPNEDFSQLMQKLSDGNSLPLIKLSQFRVLALLKVFFSFPKNSIATCFGFFSTSSTEDVAMGKYLITNMTETINDIDAASNKPEPDENSGQTDSNKIEATVNNAEGLSGIQEASYSLKSCLLGMVLGKSLSIGRWAFFKYKNICSVSSFIDISSAIPSLEAMFALVGKDIKLEDCQMESDEDDCGKFSASHVKPHSSTENDVRSSAGSVYDAERDLSCGRSSVPRGLINHHTPSPSARVPSDLRSNSADGRNNFIVGESPAIQAAPRGPSSGKIVWYLDGDPTAYDIFPLRASCHLRFQLDRYGPVDRFFFDPVKGFALAEYRSIIDAIRAREYLRAEFPWRIKFMDIGVGARGLSTGISSQWERDEIVHESRQALYKGPRMVTDLYYEHALLMEFDTPDDAAVVMAHLRFFVEKRVNFTWHQPIVLCLMKAEEGAPSCVPIPAPGQPATPTSQIPPSPFVQQPIYPPPNTSWDTRSLGHQISPSGTAIATLSQNQGPPPPQVSGPFVPPPMHPVSQSQGPPIQHVDQVYPPPPSGHSLPSVAQPPPPEMMPPPPLAQPPPLPHAHPPMVPPPPCNPQSPPPLPPTVTTQLSEPDAYDHNVEHHWQGVLSKSGVHYSTIVAQRLESDICKYNNGFSEAMQWPIKLDMTKRTDMKKLKSTFTNTQPHKREVCQLIPATFSDRKGLQDFTSYLKQRDCAGVIKIPVTSLMWARHLFILPYSEETCTMLSVTPSSSECLIGLVLPKEPNAECS
ncbi:hypothetical protein Bca52824_064244 [Brassica carinata]|uniref:Spen paralogue and orthologue SPOC C-terminal domain-containing protein n=1 Tax=Brassica carinata TaxID=52824 RepID=A0A8X7QFZ6_BRACI|nr:hypothetical protein Bca52824_064244 [Brassica carinata]